MITADHGCDPAYKASTDHTREYTPFLMAGTLHALLIIPCVHPLRDSLSGVDVIDFAQHSAAEPAEGCFATFPTPKRQ